MTARDDEMTYFTQLLKTIVKDRLETEREHFTTDLEISYKELIENAEITVTAWHRLDDAIISLDTYIWSFLQGIYQVNLPYEVPTNWWQHLKKQLGFKYKTETKYATDVVDLKVAFPECKVKFPGVLGKGRPFMVRDKGRHWDRAEPSTEG